MKFALALALFVVAASAASLGELNLRPRHIHPKIPHLPNAKVEGRITNGEVAEEKQFPYQAALWLNFVDGTAFCGGTLISHRWVLTAAHCAADATSVTVVLGTTSLIQKEPGEQQIFVSQSGIIVHENWNPDLIINDIALIKLPMEVPLSEYVQPATLPKKDGAYSTYVGDTVVASGWGKDSDSSNSVSSVLLYIDSRVISKTSCNIRYFGLIQDSNICISGENGRSTCNGDSGGPLVYHDGNKHILVGATSFGISLGCEVGWPAVFTRITSYLDWIEDNTGIVNV